MTSKQNTIYIRYGVGLLLLLVLLGGATLLVRQRQETAAEPPATIAGTIVAISDDGIRVTVATGGQDTSRTWRPELSRSVVGVITHETRIVDRNKEIPENFDHPVTLGDLYSVSFTELKVGSRVILVPFPESITANRQEFEVSAITIE